MAVEAVKVVNFKKNFGAVAAVRGINLTVRAGELFGVIGPDGAGKTTLFRTVCTLLQPGEGEFFVLGKNVRTDVFEIRDMLGYMPQRFSLYPDLSVAQNLRFFADIFQVPEKQRAERLKQLYRFSRLEPFRKRKAGDLSGGMKQKLALSCALIHTPRLLVLDEPTFGVDPVSREEFWQILQEIRREGTTILVSTAYMEEADLCDRVALMHQGKILQMGAPGKIKSTYSFPLYRIEGASARDLEKFFKKLTTVYSTQLFGDTVHVSFLAEPEASDWVKWVSQTAGNLKNWQTQPPSMEDVFMENIEEKAE